MSDRGLRYVALGDSYTIGTSVAPEERWPDQLVGRLAGGQSALDLVANLGVNGYTSRDVIEGELPLLANLRPGFASLLVGVNDVVQRVPQASYRANVGLILDRLLAVVPVDRIVAVETPDYTVTPEGASYGDRARNSAAIARTNAILGEEAGRRGVAFVSGIFEQSRAAADDRGLVADDGLHPSGRQYRLWLERIEPVVTRLLSRP